MITSELNASTDLSRLFEGFYTPRKLRGAAPNTLRQYGLTFARFAEFLGRTPLVSDLSEDAICGFLTWRRLSVAAPTANKDRSQLMALAGFCAKRGVIQLPDVEAEREPERVPMAWLSGELDALWRSCSLEPGWLEGVPASLWWKALHCVAWNSGERISALLSSRWDRIDLDRGWLVIVAEARKGKTRDKAFKLSDDTVAVLRAIQHPPRDLVFPWPYCSAYLWTKYNVILERAGLPTDRKSKFHRLRKSVASHGKKAGLDPTQLLDHSGPQVTKSYLDPRICDGLHAADVLFRPGA